MPYDKDTLFKRCLSVIKKNKPISLRDVIDLAPVSSATFYRHFPNDSPEYAEIKEALMNKKAEQKVAIRNRWEEKPNPTTDIALYKLLGTEDEVHRLNGSNMKITGEVTTFAVKLPKDVETDSD